MRLGMFGTVSACRHVLGDRHPEWMAAMCGVCLAIRDRAGQLARATVHTDAIAAAVLAADVQRSRDGTPPTVRRAGPCPARGMRTAEVWTGGPAAMGAGVSLVAAAVALRDEVHDDGLPAPHLTGRAASRFADRLDARGAPALAAAGIDVGRVRRALVASREAEADRSSVLGDWTEPVADAYGAVFAAAGMQDVGRHVGRATLLADAVADLDQDERDGAPNPILAGACDPEEARRLVRRDALAVREAVDAALPGTLSSLLWGPGFSRGITRAMGLRTCGSCAVVHAQDVDVDEDEPVWPGRTDDAPTEDEDTTSASQQEAPRTRWYDCCDPCGGCDCGLCGCDCCCDCCCDC